MAAASYGANRSPKHSSSSQRRDLAPHTSGRAIDEFINDGYGYHRNSA
jgi:hypothetical protein